MDLKRQPVHNQRLSKNTLNGIKFCETDALNGLSRLSSRQTDDQAVLSLPVSSTQKEHATSKEKDIDGLNHTTNSLYSTLVHEEDKQTDVVKPEAIKKDYKLVPSGIVLKNHAKEPKVHIPITSYIKPKAKSCI